MEIVINSTQIFDTNKDTVVIRFDDTESKNKFIENLHNMPEKDGPRYFAEFPSTIDPGKLINDAKHLHIQKCSI